MTTEEIKAAIETAIAPLRNALDQLSQSDSTRNEREATNQAKAEDAAAQAEKSKLCNQIVNNKMP